MTSRERVIRTLKRQGKPDRIPFEISWGSFTPRLMRTYHKRTGSDISPEEYFDFDTRFVLPGPTDLITDFRTFYPGVTFEDDVSFDEWGIGSVPTVYEIPDFKYHPLKQLTSVEEIDAYPWPDLGEDYRYEEVVSKTREFQDRGYAVCGEMYQTIFETAWMMRDMQDFMVDLLLNEKIAHAICEHITEVRIRQAQNFARAGVDILRLGDDMVSQQGLMMSKETYRAFFRSRIQKIITAAKLVNPDIIIFMHSCGKVEDLIEDLVVAGVEVLNPLQPECNDLQMIHTNYKDRLSFWGGIGVQSVMPHGSPDDVRLKVQETAELLGKDGGLLMAPAHILDPSIPWENIEAYIESAKQLILKNYGKA
jgi:uroporphyrinogen decarboxylase